MKLSDTAIRRPVLTSMVSIALVLFGSIAFLRLPVREYPDVDPPIVSVTTLYRGASPSVVEKYCRGDYGQKTGKGWYDYTNNK